MIFKSVATSVHGVDVSGRRVAVIASAFGVEDEDGDIIERGAYQDTIQERGPASRRPRIKVCWQHDPSDLLGVPSLIEERDEGLYVEYVVTRAGRGDDVLTWYQEGVITEHSVRISNIARDPKDTRRIIKATLWEVSPVTWGANAETPLLSLKHWPAAQPYGYPHSLYGYPQPPTEEADVLSAQEAIALIREAAEALRGGRL